MIKMKPETIERRARKAQADKVANRKSRLERLEMLVERDGADSIWAELLANESEG